MSNTTSQLEKEDLWVYLKNNPGKPIYVVEDKSIILSLEFISHSGKINSVVYVPGTENVIEKEVEVEFLKTSNYWKATHQFYTSFGMKVLLDTWEKLDKKQ
jgi:hypothetical protein